MTFLPAEIPGARGSGRLIQAAAAARVAGNDGATGGCRNDLVRADLLLPNSHKGSKKQRKLRYRHLRRCRGITDF